MKKIVGFFKKPLVFRIGVVKSLENFSEKEGIEEKFLSFMKEQMTGYLPMYLSQS